MPTDDPIVIDIQFTSEELGWASRYNNTDRLRRLMLPFIAVLTVALVLSIACFLAGQWLLGSAVLAAPFAALLPLKDVAHQGARILNANPGLGEMRTWTFSSDQIDVSSANLKSQISWEKWGRLEEHPDYFLLKAKMGNRAIVVPLRTFDSRTDVDRFRELVKKRLAS